MAILGRFLVHKGEKGLLSYELLRSDNAFNMDSTRQKAFNEHALATPAVSKSDRKWGAIYVSF